VIHQGAPGAEETRTVLKEILQDVYGYRDTDLNEIPWLEKMLKGLGDFFTTASPIILFILFSAIALIFLGFLYRFTSLFRRNTTLTGPSSVNGRGASEVDKDSRGMLRSAEVLGNEKRYSEAVIRLHQASLRSIFEEHILPPEEHATNREILKALTERPEIRESFSTIARYAEIARFRCESLDRQAFEESLTTFKKDFKP
jgi:hypothetical protein